ncbi:DUF485 domain-containing protein [Luedemannella flava]|uniref:DUF485 domain-containing protein n=1 Tax=Luedemannella flava TaxID=349316 RepID=A0ABN2LHH1_9ACTN
MTTDEPEATSGDGGSRYLQVQQSDEFAGLRRAFRRFVFPFTAAFLIWYALYVILSAYARDFMGQKVFGNVNVALIFGLLQFVTTFLIAWLYERYATNKLEPMQESLKAQVEGNGGASTVTEEEPA